MKHVPVKPENHIYKVQGPVHVSADAEIVHLPPHANYIHEVSVDGFYHQAFQIPDFATFFRLVDCHIEI